MKGQPKISAIYRLGEKPAPDPERTFARVWRWCRDLWIKQGTIVVKPKELPESLRDRMVEWANQTYGERHDRKKKHFKS